MSSSSSNANPNPVPAVEPAVWRTTFEVNGRPVTIEDTVMDNEDIAVAVARDMILPRCRASENTPRGVRFLAMAGFSLCYWN